MKIGLDFDEVLCWFIEPLANRLWLKYNQITKYELWEILNIEKKKVVNLAIDLMKEDYKTNHKIFKPIKYSEKLVNLCLWQNVYIITSRPSFLEKETNSFINHFFPNLKIKKIIFVNKNENIELWKKYKILKQLWLDIFIEDNLDNLIESVKFYKKWFLLKKPWNKNDIRLKSLNNKIITIDSLYDINF